MRNQGRITNGQRNKKASASNTTEKGAKSKDLKEEALQHIAKDIDNEWKQVESKRRIKEKTNFFRRQNQHNITSIICVSFA